jgi:hypothetical protein
MNIAESVNKEANPYVKLAMYAMFLLATGGVTEVTTSAVASSQKEKDVLEERVMAMETQIMAQESQQRQIQEQVLGMTKLMYRKLTTARGQVRVGLSGGSESEIQINEHSGAAEYGIGDMIEIRSRFGNHAVIHARVAGTIGREDDFQVLGILNRFAAEKLGINVGQVSQVELFRVEIRSIEDPF